MKIKKDFIEIRTTFGVVIYVDVGPKDCVAKIKKRIQDALKIPYHFQEMRMGNRLLLDHIILQKIRGFGESTILWLKIVPFFKSIVRNVLVVLRKYKHGYHNRESDSYFKYEPFMVVRRIIPKKLNGKPFTFAVIIPLIHPRNLELLEGGMALHMFHKHPYGHRFAYRELTH